MIELNVRLISDTSFGRGDGVAGLIDAEVEHDAVTGLPYIRGRVLKGLLTEECANLIYAAGNINPDAAKRLERSAKFLFGQAGSTLDDDALMHISAATLPEDLIQAVESNIKLKELTSMDVLDSLTTIRRQTAVNETTGAPDAGSLRSMRAVLREVIFTATLEFEREPHAVDLALLTACALSIRRGGIGRNRGRGRLQAWLNDVNYTLNQFTLFENILREVA